MAAPNNLVTLVNVCEDTDKSFTIESLLAAAGYVPQGPVMIATIQVKNPDGTFSTAPTSLVRVSDDKTSMVITASNEQDWYGYLETLNLVVESGDELFSIKVGVTVDPVNDAPEGADNSIVLTDSAGYVFQEDDFGFTDPVEGDSFQSVVISSVPGAGQLLLNGVLLAAGAEVSIAAIRAGALVYQPPSSGAGQVNFGFQVRDDGGTVGCNASDLDATPNTITLQLPPLGSLGDRIWYDTDRDGVQDSTETGVAGVTVTLAGAGADGVFGTADDISRSTTTNGTGNYLFTGLAAGNYQVTFGGVPGYQFTSPNVGDDGLDSDVNANGISQVVNLAAGQANLTVDAGVVAVVPVDPQTAQLGDRVWYDTDRDGVQDSTETGVAGVAVTLAGAGADGVFGTADDISRSTVTNGTGNYLFTGLAAGNYQVTFGSVAGYQLTTANVGNDATDSDAIIGTGKSQVVALAVGESNLTVDAGLVQTDTNTAQLGDRVWYDTDRDGVQDSTETGVADVIVVLAGAGADGVFGTADDISRSTTTNSTGNYLFTGLAAGNYQVTFGGKAGYQLTTANVGNDATDSDAIIGTGKSQVVSLAIGESNLTVDAGLVQTDTHTAQLGDRVWYDTDRDGVQDSTETGVAGVAVTLAGAGADGVFGTADDISRSTTTNGTGNYLFTGLAAGQYQVTFGSVAGYQLTTANVGNDATDSDAIIGTGKSQVVALAIGESNLTVDAGLVQTDTNTAQLGDRVWYDADRDGVQDSTENGAGGVTVTLAGAGADGVFGTADDISRSTTTNGTGNYLFTGLAAGQYQVTFGSRPGYELTTANVGNDATDSDAIVGTGKSQVVALAIGESNLTVDAGLVQIDTNTGSLGDRVWIDANGNGLQDGGEASVVGATVRLLDANGQVLATQLTDASGNYLFTGLAAGQYAVQVVAPNGYKFTTANAGGNDATDSDTVWDGAGTQTGTSGLVTLQIGESNRTVDAGVQVCLVKIGDKVWMDADGDGVQDAGEAGVAGVTMTLTGTGADGVFGTQDDTVRTTTTDASGNYLFSDVAWGQYKVGMTMPNGMALTTANAGGNDAVDSDFLQTTGVAAVSNLITNGSFESGTAGWTGLGDIVEVAQASWSWFGVTGATGTYVAELDANVAGSGTGFYQDVQTETNRVYQLSVDVAARTGTALSTNTVEVWWGANRVATIDPTSTTLSTYTFNVVGSGGAVRLSFREQAGDDDSCGGVIDNVRLTAPAGPSTYSAHVTVNSCDDILTIDAGLVDPKTACLGDRVWYDTDRDGVQDSNETGVSGVAVTLAGAGSDGVFGTADDISRSTTTNSTGYYSFTGLAAGQYQVTFGGKTGYQFTTANVGSDAADSDAATTTGKSHVVTLAAGESNQTVDAGLVVTDTNNACLGDRVWYDTDRDGVQDSGESGASGISVTLAGAGSDGVFGTADDISRSTTTNSTGYYLFSGLAAGQYQVTFGGKTGYQYTTANVGSDSTDSDASTTTGKSDVVTLAIGQSNMTVDAGLVTKQGTASVGDRVWNDVDKDGIQDVGETQGIYNVKVRLFDYNDNVVATTYTNSSGNYLFSNLNAGYYYLEFDKSNATAGGSSVANSNWVWTYQDRGSNDAADSDVVHENSSTNVTWTEDWFYLAEGQADRTRDAGMSPIAIDLNGDGIQTVARGASDSTFDLFGNGSAVQSGWLSGSDGFLAVDRDGNGKIDDINELFGGTSKGQGFAKLASFDSNGDGVVDAQDDNFDALRVWQDVNGNHQTDAGELMTLAQAGVAAMTVAYTELPFLDAQGNLHLERSNATMADGSSVDMTDVYFNVDVADAAAAGVELPTIAELLGTDNALLDQALGGGSAREQAAALDVGFDAAGEAQRAIAKAMQQADAAFALAP